MSNAEPTDNQVKEGDFILKDEEAKKITEPQGPQAAKAASIAAIKQALQEKVQLLEVQMAADAVEFLSSLYPEAKGLSDTELRWFLQKKFIRQTIDRRNNGQYLYEYATTDGKLIAKILYELVPFKSEPTADGRVGVGFDLRSTVIHPIVKDAPAGGQ